MILAKMENRVAFPFYFQGDLLKQFLNWVKLFLHVQMQLFGPILVSKSLRRILVSEGEVSSKSQKPLYSYVRSFS